MTRRVRREDGILEVLPPGYHVVSEESEVAEVKAASDFPIPLALPTVVRGRVLGHAALPVGNCRGTIPMRRFRAKEV